MNTASDPAPLVVDLESTLLRSDVKREQAVLSGGQGLSRLVSALKPLGHNVAIDIDPSILPLNPTTLALLQREHAAGRRIILGTRGNIAFAERVAAHVGLFSEVRNIDGAEAEVFAADRRSVATWLRAIRVHQWVKNLLVFVPLITSHQFTDTPLVVASMLAFVCFSLCASATYLFNDLTDLEDDRRHPVKRHRPLAAGEVGLTGAAVAALVMVLVAFFVAIVALPAPFTIALAAYFVLTIAYSSFLKRKEIVDVLSLAMLYTLRVVAGTFAIDGLLTFWLLGFSMFIFLSLALVKRYSELVASSDDGVDRQMPGRGYAVSDRSLIVALGCAAAYQSVLVLALYVQDYATRALYSHPQYIWLACPLLLYWISRVWMLTHRGRMTSDPVVFALRDHISLCIGALFGLVFWLAA